MPAFTRLELLELWRNTRDPKTLSQHLRHNALELVQEAGSGHVGTSFSVMDVLVAVHLFEQEGLFPSPPSGHYRLFSSKGHDAPALYAVNHLLGLIEDKDLKLRRLGFLPGHPEIGTGGTITNTGSLGMGISKAKGFAAADYLTGVESTTYVVLGDGELQEGQIWESMIDAQKVLGKVVAIVDGNGIQSDSWVSRTRDLGDVKARVESSGWFFLRVNGHNFSELREALVTAKVSNFPVFIWADTTKGKGSEPLTYFPEDGRFYPFHSGALSKELAQDVSAELLSGDEIRNELVVDYSRSSKMDSNSLPNIWAKLLLDASLQNKEIVVLDGDLALDTGTYLAAEVIGNRYMQMGIAEQDMVSTAGTLALSGYRPFVHSFATFLTMRPFEQIVNNASEKSAVVYVGFLAGIVPSAAGFSHQSVIDLATMSIVPGMAVYEPATAVEIRSVLERSLHSEGPTYLRMNSVAVVEKQGSPYWLNGQLGGTLFGDGSDYLVLCSGAFTLGNALQAQEILAKTGLHGTVASVLDKKTGKNYAEYFHKIFPGQHVLMVENGTWFEGALSQLYNSFEKSGKLVEALSIEGFPVNGQPDEVSAHHGMDMDSLVAVIKRLCLSSD